MINKNMTFTTKARLFKDPLKGGGGGQGRRGRGRATFFTEHIHKKLLMDQE